MFYWNNHRWLPGTPVYFLDIQTTGFRFYTRPHYPWEYQELILNPTKILQGTDEEIIEKVDQAKKTKKTGFAALSG